MENEKKIQIHDISIWFNFINELSLQIQAFLKINNIKYINNTNKFRLGQWLGIKIGKKIHLQIYGPN